MRYASPAAKQNCENECARYCKSLRAPRRAKRAQTNNHALATDAAIMPVGRKNEIVASAAAEKIIHLAAGRNTVGGSDSSSDGISAVASGITIQGASRNKSSITPSWPAAPGPRNE